MIKETGARIMIEETGARIRIEETGARIKIEETGARIMIEETGARIMIKETGARIMIEETGARIMIEETGARIMIKETRARIIVAPHIIEKGWNCDIWWKGRSIASQAVDLQNSWRENLKNDNCISWSEVVWTTKHPWEKRWNSCMDQCFCWSPAFGQQLWEEQTERGIQKTSDPQWLYCILRWLWNPETSLLNSGSTGRLSALRAKKIKKLVSISRTLWLAFRMPTKELTWI